MTEIKVGSLKDRGWKLNPESGEWTIISESRKFKLTIVNFGVYSNMEGRDWCLHVGRAEDDEFVGSYTLETYEQLEEFMNLLETDMPENIFEETMESNGWEEDYDPILEEEEPGLGISWTKEVLGGKYYLRLTKWSVLKGRRWGVHIDNRDFDSVASMSVSNYKQIDDLINCLEEPNE